MTTWSASELDRLGSAGELRIAGMRTDGSLRKPVTIWGVRVADAFYVRSVYGVTGGWFKGTRATHTGWIDSGGVDKDVSFEDIDPSDPVNEEIDAAYRSKYGAGSSAVEHITSVGARAATLQVLLRVAQADEAHKR